jgi:Tfp pilus assembly protein PilO
MYLSIRAINIGCLAGFLALAIGGNFVAARSAKAKADRVDHDVQAAKVLLGEFNKAQSALLRLDATLKANQTALETLRKRLPESDPIGGFLADLDALASKTDVKVNKVAPGESVREDICTRTPLAFSCEGSFAGLHAVLHGLEHMDRLVRAEQVSISRSSPSTRCSMDITCSVYGR